MEPHFTASVPYLLAAINNDAEAAIVKHEAIIALGDIIEDPKLIEEFYTHKE